MEKLTIMDELDGVLLAVDNLKELIGDFKTRYQEENEF